MTRRQARRRKTQKAVWCRIPTIRTGFIIAPMIAITVIVATYYLSTSALDRPIRSIEISGPLQRVTAMQIEAAISDELGDGFVSVDLGIVQQKIIALPWIDQATVARRWPSRLRISVT